MSNTEKEYATVDVDEGDNYRDIAEILTKMGHPMNHSSARNYVLRVMKLFVEAYVKNMNIDMSEDDMIRLAKSAQFQHLLSERLHVIERQRRNRILINMKLGAKTSRKTV